MHRLHRFADDFFDSHFFALRFAVGSQCPKFDSQTAMRYRVNYSLPRVNQQYLVKWKGYDDPTWEPEDFLLNEAGVPIVPLQLFLRGE